MPDKTTVPRIESVVSPLYFSYRKFCSEINVHKIVKSCVFDGRDKNIFSIHLKFYIIICEILRSES